MRRPSSYIKTEGVAATRSADVIKIDGTAFSDFCNNNAGSVVVSFSGNYVGAVNFVRVVELSDGTNESRITSFVPNGPTEPQELSVFNRARSESSVVPGVYNNQPFTGAFGYDETGVQAVSASDVGVLQPGVNIGLSQITLGTSVVAGNINGHMPLVVCFPRRLPNATLQQLSALEL